MRLTPPDGSAIAKGGILITARQQLFERSVADWYRHCHIYSDYELMAEIIEQEAPFLSPEIDRQQERHFMYANNLLVTSWSEFDELCRFWFAVLKRVASNLRWPRGDDSYQNRDVAFLSERFFDAWIRYKAACGCTIGERPLLFVED